MSRKTKRHKRNMENQSMEMSSGMPTGNELAGSTEQPLDAVVGTVNNNKMLIGSIAGACGAGIFLLATDSGKRMRNGIQNRAAALYHDAFCRLSDGWDQMRGYAGNMLPATLSRAEPEVRQTSSRRQKVA